MKSVYRKTLDQGLLQQLKTTVDEIDPTDYEARASEAKKVLVDFFRKNGMPLTAEWWDKHGKGF